MRNACLHEGHRELQSKLAHTFSANKQRHRHPHATAGIPCLSLPYPTHTLSPQRHPPTLTPSAPTQPQASGYATTSCLYSFKFTCGSRLESQLNTISSNIHTTQPLQPAPSSQHHPPTNTLRPPPPPKPVYTLCSSSPVAPAVVG